MSEAILVVQFLSAVARLGGNLTVAVQEVSDLLQREHDAGRELSREKLFELMDKTDILRGEAIARAKEALARQGG